MPDGRSVPVVFRHAGAVLAVGAALISTGWLFASLLPHKAPLIIETGQLDEPPSVMVIAGRPLDEWREIMKSVDLNDPARGQYVPALIEIVQSPQAPWFTRRQAAQTLGRWGNAAVDAVPVLERLLDDSHSDTEEATSLWALKGLSLFGPLAASAAPNVSRVALDPHRPESHRLAAIECLSQIGTAHASTIAPLIQIAQNNGDHPQTTLVRRGAIEAIGMYRGGAAVAIPVLLRFLDDRDVDIRREAAVSLGRQGIAAEIVQPALFDLMIGDEDPAVRDAAGVALSQSGTAILPALSSLLEAPDAELRWRGAHTLGLFGRQARTTASPLQSLWDDPVPFVQIAALEASWKITVHGEAIALRTARLLSHDDRPIRRQAYLLLERLGPSAVPAQGILRELRDHPRSEIRQAAQKLLIRLETDADR